MSPKYKLIYFDGRGRAEPVRLMFAYKKMDYVDQRIKFEEWASLKPNMPLGQLPVLEIQGVRLAESVAIMRFVAKELGLAGKNNVEAAQADMYMDFLKDCFSQPRGVLEKDETKQKELLHKFLTEILPPCFSKLEEFLKKNGGIYFVGDGYTWADFGIACGAYEIQVSCESTMKKYPTLANHMRKIHALPGIKEWIEKRPATVF